MSEPDPTGRRIADALAGLPDADPAVVDRVARRAGDLAARGRPAQPVRRRLAWGLLAAAAVAGTGAALAGTGTITVRVGSGGRPAAVAEPSTQPLTLPPGARGIGVLVDGRVHVRTRGGVGIDGLPASALELSPNATYLALGQRGALTVLAASGRRAWSLPVTGTVTSVAWSPDPVWIAYTVRVARDMERLRVVEGDGDHDRDVGPVESGAGLAWTDDGTAVRFRRDGRWMTHHALAGRTAPGGVPVPGGPRMLPGSPGTEVLAHARSGDAQVWLVHESPRRLRGVWQDPAGDRRSVVRVAWNGGVAGVVLR